MNEQNPKVFISYSHDSEEHKKWVLNLATKLVNHGVDVILDQWDLRIGQDLRFFMEKGINSAKLVLCICSEKYVEKSDNGNGGAGYESMILTQELLKNVNLDYIIPIIRNNRTNKKTPTCLGTKLYIDFEEDDRFYDKYRELIERIYSQDILKRPKLGENPFENNMGIKVNTKKSIEMVKYRKDDFIGKVDFDYSNNNGEFIVGVGEYEFSTRWSGASNNVIYAYGDIGYKNKENEFPKFEHIIEFDFSSRVRRVEKNEIVIYKNSYNKFLAIKILLVDSKSHGKENERLVFEYKIYKEC